MNVTASGARPASLPHATYIGKADKEGWSYNGQMFIDPHNAYGVDPFVGVLDHLKKHLCSDMSRGSEELDKIEAKLWRHEL
jgi:hypothetical protein